MKVWIILNFSEMFRKNYVMVRSMKVWKEKVRFFKLPKNNPIYFSLASLDSYFSNFLNFLGILHLVMKYTDVKYCPKYWNFLTIFSYWFLFHIFTSKHLSILSILNRKVLQHSAPVFNFSTPINMSKYSCIDFIKIKSPGFFDEGYSYISPC